MKVPARKRRNLQRWSATSKGFAHLNEGPHPKAEKWLPSLRRLLRLDYLNESPHPKAGKSGRFRTVAPATDGPQ